MRISRGIGAILLASEAAAALYPNKGKTDTMKTMVACKYTVGTEQKPLFSDDFSELCLDSAYMEAFLNCATVEIGKLPHGDMQELSATIEKTCQRPLAKYPTLKTGNYSTSLFLITYKSYDAKVHHDTVSVWVGTALLVYWISIVGLGTIYNLLNKLAPRQLVSLKKTTNNIIFRKCRQALTVPALYGVRHAEHNKWGEIIPTRLESFILAGLVILVVLGAALGYRSVPGNVAYASRTGEMLAAVGHRASTILIYLVPFTFLFGTRNNVLLWLTGWKQSTFYAFHKNMGNILILLALTHFVGMYEYLRREERIPSVKGERFYKFGITLVVLIFVFFFQTLGWFRRRSYKLFVVFHIILAAGFLGSLWRHTKSSHFLVFCKATVGLWGVDRIITIIRLASFGVRNATIKIVSDEVISLVVQNKSWWSAFPGAYGYVYFLTPSLFLQSHPFTFVNDNDGYLHFYIKIKEGSTKVLYNRLLKCENQEDVLKISVAGPFGTYNPLDIYDTVLLYTSGNGIPGPFAYCKHLATNANEKSQFIKLYWVIRNWNSLDWFYEELKELAAFSNVAVVVYVTRYSEAKIGYKHIPEDASSATDRKAASAGQVRVASFEEIVQVQDALPHVEFREGRPDIPHLVGTDLEEASQGSTAIMTCAHPAMCDTIRAEVAKAVGSKSNRTIDFFEELQGW
ncbi:AGR328Cp [Eremothecium gossypii ATCC 10895]|uniref:ferric-chelate reductase (NADPH) n=1 Tax=Eremothecium gossypii (strain ATCC 10895 / CBS 109.51 / FGSC 9923 / NRRL Y-1056) TaxID=284811 RepID=Q74Z78_EREGS|nr:AGR328Cp [Eremothecium gossypii ATCC 10895]AAS54818.1 AGR328Cp [Eremothecium gossypii ATCC 10895]AEY99150.1 FAGR328Cp [Eremothecium gossypii FDAG1]